MSELRQALDNAVAQSETAIEAPVVTMPSPQTIETVSDPIVETKDQTSVPSTKQQDNTASNESNSSIDSKAQKTQPNTPASEESKIAARVDRPPSSWKNEAKQAWEAMPLQVRQEIHRREREFNKYIQDTSVAKNVHDQLGQILQPHMEIFNAAGTHPLAVINNLLNQGKVLWTGSPEQKASMAVQILMDCGIDPVLVDKIWGNKLTASKDPNFTNMQELIQRELAPIKQQIGQANRQVQQQPTVNEQAIFDELSAFADSHEHFYDVKDDIADIIELNAKRGKSVSLEDAYKMALNMNSVGQQTQPQAPQPKVNLSISGAPSVGAVQADGTDLRGTLERAFSNVRI